MNQTIELLNKNLFFPRDSSFSEALAVRIDDEIELHCYYKIIKPDAPTIVYFHGNGETVADYVASGFHDRLISACFGQPNLLMIEYRGYGGSTGTPDLIAMLGDGSRVLDALNLDPSTCIAYGRSIGSLYAVELAANCPSLAGLILDSGIADIEQWLQEKPRVWEQLGEEGQEQLQHIARQHFDQKRKIANFSQTLLVLHTKYDSIVSSDFAESFYAWSPAKWKELRVYLRGDHNNIFPENEKDYIESLNRCVVRMFPEHFTLRRVPILNFDRPENPAWIRNPIRDADRAKRGNVYGPSEEFLLMPYDEYDNVRPQSEIEENRAEVAKPLQSTLMQRIRSRVKGFLLRRTI